jgi:malate permease and related proteins
LVFFSIVFPVFFIIFIGFIFGKLVDIDFRAISKLVLYVFNPALYFNSMLTANVDGEEFVKVIIYAIVLFFSFIALTYLLNGTLLKFSQQMRSALILSTAFPNSGNYGLPIILFAFGEIGFDRAVIFTVLQSLLMNSAGVYFASNSNNSFKDSMKDVLKMPGFIALLIAIIMKNFNIMPYDFLMRPIVLMGQAAIPSLLAILGIQLSRVKIEFDWKFITSSVILRLFVYPVVAFIIISFFFGFNDLTGKVLLVLAATPSAVSTTLLAIQYDAKPQLVSTITLITTLLSMVTISILLSLLV